MHIGTQGIPQGGHPGDVPAAPQGKTPPRGTPPRSFSYNRFPVPPLSWKTARQSTSPKERCNPPITWQIPDNSQTTSDTLHKFDTRKSEDLPGGVPHGDPPGGGGGTVSIAQAIPNSVAQGGPPGESLKGVTLVIPQVKDSTHGKLRTYPGGVPHPSPSGGGQ